MAHARVVHDSPADPLDLSALDGRRVAVLGFGNQGAAQAANLRDSGITPAVGNRDDDYAEHARDQGFAPVALAEAAAGAQVLMLLVPDEVQPEVVARDVAPHLGEGDTLVLASGYNWFFGLLEVPDGVDVVMVAPRMIGAAVRDRYVDRTGFPCFVSVERDASGRAWDTALALARAIGGTLGGAIVSSAREEAALDLFSEQAVWPAVLDLHSRTSQYGQLRALAGLDTDGELHGRFDRVLRDDILSGAFAREWSHPEAGDRLEALRRDAEASPLAKAESAVRERLDPGR